MMLAAFAQPIFDSQRTFRELLQAMARPALARALPVLPPAPAPVTQEAMAILLTLCDATTSVWLQQPDEEVIRHLRFHAGLKLVDQPQDADFALITEPLTMPVLEVFARGDLRYPDRSASLIIQVAAISSSPCSRRKASPVGQGEVGRGCSDAAPSQECPTPPQPSPASRGGSNSIRHFVGPGIRDIAALTIEGLPADFWQQRAALATQLPLGIDLYLVAAQQVVGLPRTTRLLEG